MENLVAKVPSESKHYISLDNCSVQSIGTINNTQVSRNYMIGLGVHVSICMHKLDHGKVWCMNLHNHELEAFPEVKQVGKWVTRYIYVCTK